MVEHSGLEQITAILMILNNKSAFEKLFVCRTLSEAKWNGNSQDSKVPVSNCNPPWSHMTCPQRYTCVKHSSVFNGTIKKLRNPIGSFYFSL